MPKRQKQKPLPRKRRKPNNERTTFHKNRRPKNLRFFFSVEKLLIAKTRSLSNLISEQIASINEASKSVAILRSANMSLGINTLFKLLQDAAKVFASAGFDIEIVEKHHNQKLDAPSGTALALADSMKEVLDDDYFYRYDRSQLRQKRDPKEIGISAVRGGTIVGEHEVIFAGEDEVIEFKHTAHSKAVFAKGAVEAAKFLAGKPAGMYDMRDVIAAKN